MTREQPAIVVGIDFSSESELAARQALAIARHLGGELVLVHVRATVELPPPPAGSGSERRALEQGWRDTESRALAGARDELADLRERLSGQGVTISQLLVEDYPADGICAAARELAARFTVVGTHGRTGLRWIEMGSVAQHVVRQSAGDVLVARPGRRDGYHRILVATDFSPAAERALDGAIALAAPGAEVLLVHQLAMRWPAGRGGPIELLPFEVDALVEQARREGAALVARKQRGDLELRFHVSVEAPLPAIIHWLETHGCDLAAVGSHGRRGFRRFLLGSVAEAVVRRAPCSVLVAHAGATEG